MGVSGKASKPVFLNNNTTQTSWLLPCSQVMLPQFLRKDVDSNGYKPSLTLNFIFGESLGIRGLEFRVCRVPLHVIFGFTIRTLHKKC